MKRYLLTTMITAFCLCSSHAVCESGDALMFESLFEITAENCPSSTGGNMNAFLTNKKGDLAWVETIEPHVAKCFFWDKENGLKEIDIYESLFKLGFEPIKKSATVTNFRFYLEHLDDEGNVFVKFEHKVLEDVLDHRLKRNGQYKCGVWDRKQEFKLLEIPQIDDVIRLKVTDGTIIVTGFTRSFEEKLVVLKKPQNLWNDDTIGEIINIATPWEKMPLGNIGARLYAIEQLYKHPKSKKERKHIVHTVESEAAHVLDSLQYQAKNAEFLIDKANEEGVENPQAEKDYNDAMIAIEELRKMLKNMVLRKNWGRGANWC